MHSIIALWLPILVSSVIVFVASSLLHMALPWHKGDMVPLPKQDDVMDTLRTFDIPPGDYMIPCPGSAQEMRSEEFKQKFRRGPTGIMTIYPPGPIAIGKNLVMWFIYLLVVGTFSGYIAAHAVPFGAGHYRPVFRFVGAAAFMGYAFALWQDSIWWRRKWSTTIKSTIDGLIYALLTAGTFGWLWPK